MDQQRLILLLNLLLLSLANFGCTTSQSTQDLTSKQVADNSSTEIINSIDVDRNAIAEDFFNRAMIYYYQNYFDEAIFELTQSLRYDSTAGQYYFLGQCYSNKSRPGLAKHYYEQALSHDSLHRESLEELIKYHAGAEQTDTLMGLVHTFVGAYGVTPVLLQSNIKTLYALYPSETLEVLNNNVSNLTSRNVLFDCVHLAESLNDTDLYLKVLERLYTLSPRNSELASIFYNATFALNKPEIAANGLRNIRRLPYADQREVTANLLQLLQTYLNENKNVGVVEDMCMQLVSFRDHNIRGRALFTLSETGNINLAEHHFSRLSTQHPDVEIYHYGVAEMNSRLQRWTRSIEAYEKVEFAPSFNNPYLQNAFAYTLACADQKLTKADSLIDLALRELPDNINFIDTKAWVQFRLGKLEQARQLIDRCIRDVDASGEMFAHAAEIYASLGHNDEARSFVIRAIQLQPNNSQWRLLQESLEE